MANILNLKNRNKPTPKKKKPKKEDDSGKKKAYLRWTAPEFNQYEKSRSWFIIAGLITVLIFAWAIFAGNFVFALLVGLSYFTITIYALKKPRTISLAITPRGIKVDEAIYNFDNLKSFWIFYDPPELKEVSLRSKKLMMP